MILRPLPKGDLVSCDTETTGLLLWQGDRGFAFSFCNEVGETGLVRWDVDPFTREVRVIEREWRLLQEYLSDRSKSFVFWNALFDLLVYQMHDIEVLGTIEEAYYAWHIIDNLGDNRLKPRAERVLKYPQDDKDALDAAVACARRQGRKLGWKLGPSTETDRWMAGEELNRYTIRDAERTMLLWLAIQQLLSKEDRESYEFERRLISAFRSMINRGIALDRQKAVELKTTEDRVAREQVAALWKMAGWRVNLKKHSDLRKLLFQQFGLPVYERTTSTFQPATRWSALKKIKHPAVAAIARYRAAKKLTETYYSRYLDLAVSEGGTYVIHPNIRQVGPKTSRTAISDPSMQNIPTEEVARGAVPLEARSCLGPRPGCIWLSGDYEQVEVRIYADLVSKVTGNNEMLDIIRSGLNFHAVMADRIWGTSPFMAMDSLRKAGRSEVTEREAMRWLEEHNWSIVAAEASIGQKTTYGRGKIQFFRRIFGGGLRRAAESMDVDLATAEAVFSEYAAAMPYMDETMSKISHQVERLGYVCTAYGRRLYVPRDKSYMGVNYYVQGSAAGLMKRAIGVCYAYLQDESPVLGHLVLVIHDELIAELETREVPDEVAAKLAALMEDHGGAFEVDMPVEVSIVRESWNKKEKWQPK